MNVAKIISIVLGIFFVFLIVLEMANVGLGSATWGTIATDLSYFMVALFAFALGLTYILGKGYL